MEGAEAVIVEVEVVLHEVEAEVSSTVCAGQHGRAVSMAAGILVHGKIQVS